MPLGCELQLGVEGVDELVGGGECVARGAVFVDRDRFVDGSHRGRVAAGQNDLDRDSHGLTVRAARESDRGVLAVDDVAADLAHCEGQLEDRRSIPGVDRDRGGIAVVGQGDRGAGASGQRDYRGDQDRGGGTRKQPEEEIWFWFVEHSHGVVGVVVVVPVLGDVVVTGWPVVVVAVLVVVGVVGVLLAGVVVVVVVGGVVLVPAAVGVVPVWD